MASSLLTSSDVYLDRLDLHLVFDARLQFFLNGPQLFYCF